MLGSCGARFPPEFRLSDAPRRFDDDDLPPKLAFAVRQAFCAHGVRNQRQFVLMLAFRQQLNGGHGNVNGVRDQFAVEFVVQKRAAHRADFAVMERTLRVVGVRDVFSLRTEPPRGYPRSLRPYGRLKERYFPKRGASPARPRPPLRERA